VDDLVGVLRGLAGNRDAPGDRQLRLIEGERVPLDASALVDLLDAPLSAQRRESGVVERAAPAQQCDLLDEVCSSSSRYGEP
jgi:hypothetical protein